MSEPWEDFAPETRATETLPWEDFATPEREHAKLTVKPKELPVPAYPLDLRFGQAALGGMGAVPYQIAPEHQGVMEPGLQLPRWYPKSTAAKIIAAPVNVVEGLVESTTVPAFAPLLAGGPLLSKAGALVGPSAGVLSKIAPVVEKAVPKVLGLGFGVPAAYEGAKQIYEGKGELQPTLEGALNVGVGGLMAGAPFASQRPGSVQGPIATGEVLRTPEGAKPPPQTEIVIQTEPPEAKATVAPTAPPVAPEKPYIVAGKLTPDGEIIVARDHRAFEQEGAPGQSGYVVVPPTVDEMMFEHDLVTLSPEAAEKQGIQFVSISEAQAAKGDIELAAKRKLTKPPLSEPGKAESDLEKPRNLKEQRPEFSGNLVALKLKDGRVFWSYSRMHSQLFDSLINSGVVKDPFTEIVSQGFIEKGKYAAGGEGNVDWQAARKEHSKSAKPPLSEPGKTGLSFGDALAKREAEEAARMKSAWEKSEYVPAIRLANGKVVESKAYNEGHGELKEAYFEPHATAGFVKRATGEFMTSLEVARDRMPEVKVEAKPEAVVEPAPKAKEPWEMTLSEMRSVVENDPISAAAIRVGDQVFSAPIHAEAVYKAEEKLGRILGDGDIDESGYTTRSGKFVSQNVGDVLKNMATSGDDAYFSNVAQAIQAGEKVPKNILDAYRSAEEPAREPPTAVAGEEGQPGTVTAAPGTAKEPWQMTKAEWESALERLGERAPVPILTHKGYVRRALEKGKPVPPEVLADYPDLAKPTPPQAPGLLSSKPSAIVSSNERGTQDKGTQVGGAAAGSVGAGEPAGAGGNSILPESAVVAGGINAGRPLPGSPKSLAELQQAFETTGLDKTQSSALGALVQGVAKYLGIDVDQYVRNRFAEVTKGGELSADALYKSAEEANSEAINSYFQKHPQTRDDNAYFTKAVRYLRGLAGRDVGTSAIRGNKKTILSVDVSADCPLRQIGAACLQCYVDSPRAQMLAQVLKWAKDKRGIEARIAEINPDNHVVLRTRTGLMDLGSVNETSELMRGDGYTVGVGLTPNMVYHAAPFTDGDIANMPKPVVQFMNSIGGLRVFSNGDYLKSDVGTLDRIVREANQTGLKLKVITKQREMFERYKNFDNVYFNLSTQLEPKFAKHLSEQAYRVLSKDPDVGVDKARKLADGLQLFLDQGGMRSPWSLDEVAKLRAKYPRVAARYVAMNRAEYIAAVADPRIQVVTMYHGPTNPDVMLRNWSASAGFKYLFNPTSKGGLGLGENGRQAISAIFQQPKAGKLTEKGEINQAEIDSVLGPGKMSEAKLLNLADRKTCCQGQACGVCTVGCGFGKRAVKDGLAVLTKLIDGEPIAGVEFLSDTRAVIRAFEGNNVASMAHELGHVFRRDLKPEDLAIIEKELHVVNGAWKREHEERFANGFERYLREGKAPTPELTGVFAQFKQWLIDIYRRIKGSSIDVKLTPQIRSVMDKLLAKEADKNAALTAEPPKSATTEAIGGEPGPGAKTEHTGLGGAVPSEYGAGTATSNKNATVDKERISRGEEPMMAPLRRTWGEVWDRAMGEIDKNPAIGEQLTAELLKNPHALQDWENAILLHRRVDLRNEYAKATRDAATAYEDSKTYPDRIEGFREAQARVQFFSDKLLELEKATGKGGAGTETGRALNARKMMANDDFTLASLETQKRADVGFRPLTDAERAELKRIADEHKRISDELQVKLDAANKKIEEIEAQRILSQAQADAAKQTEPKKKAVDVVNKTPAQVAADFVEGIKKKVADKRAKKQNADISWHAKKLAAFFVEGGTRDRNTLITQVHDVLKQAIPELTRRQTMDILSGYGDYRPLDKEPVKAILRDLYGQMQQVGKLEDMMGGKAPKKTGPERRTPSDEERRLIKQVEEKKRQGGYSVTDPERQLRTALQAIQARLENQIADLTHQIDTRTKIVKEKHTVVLDAKTRDLMARRDVLKEQFDEIFNLPMTDAQRLAAWKERTQKKILDYTARIKAGDFKPKPKPDPIRFDNEALHLRFELYQIHKAWLEGRMRDQLAQQTMLQKGFRYGGEALNLVRSLLTSFDLSALLRQGGFIAFGHPFRALSSIPAQFKALASEKGQFKVMEEIRTRPNAPLYDQAKLYLSEHGTQLSQMEEVYMSRLAEKIPGIRASARAYTTFLNKLRADSFDAMAKTLSADGNITLPEAKVIANFINEATGRGSVGLNKQAAALNTFFFAPRYVVSRFQLATGHPVWGEMGTAYKGTLKARALVAAEYARFIAGFATVATLGLMAGGVIETDPKSADFMKLRFGDTTIDFLAGISQAIVLEERLRQGKMKTKAGIVPIRGKVPYGSSSAWDVMASFGRRKLAPVPGAVVDIFTGEDVNYQPVTPASLTTKLAVPISWQDVVMHSKKYGIPAATVLTILNILGVGVQTRRDAERLPTPIRY